MRYFAEMNAVWDAWVDQDSPRRAPAAPPTWAATKVEVIITAAVSKAAQRLAGIAHPAGRKIRVIPLDAPRVVGARPIAGRHPGGHMFESLQTTFATNQLASGGVLLALLDRRHVAARAACARWRGGPATIS